MYSELEVEVLEHLADQHELTSEPGTVDPEKLSEWCFARSCLALLEFNTAIKCAEIAESEYPAENVPNDQRRGFFDYLERYVRYVAPLGIIGMAPMDVDDIRELYNEYADGQPVAKLIVREAFCMNDFYRCMASVIRNLRWPEEQEEGDHIPLDNIDYAQKRCLDFYKDLQDLLPKGQARKLEEHCLGIIEHFETTLENMEIPVSSCEMYNMLMTYCGDTSFIVDFDDPDWSIQPEIFEAKAYEFKNE